MTFSWAKDNILMPMLSSVSHGIPWMIAFGLAFAFYGEIDRYSGKDKWRSRKIAVISVAIIIVPVCVAMRWYEQSFIKTVAYLMPPIIFGIIFGERWKDTEKDRS